MDIKPYSKKELALAYGPDMSMNGALKRLSQWMHRNADLMTALERTGYRSNQRLLTSYQVRLIFEYLGEP